MRTFGFLGVGLFYVVFEFVRRDVDFELFAWWWVLRVVR